MGPGKALLMGKRLSSSLGNRKTPGRGCGKALRFQSPERRLLRVEEVEGPQRGRGRKVDPPKLQGFGVNSCKEWWA